MRLLVLENIPTPHTAPMFAALSRLPGIELSVLFCASTEGYRRWHVSSERSYDAQVLPGRELKLFERWDTLSFHLNVDVGDALARRPWDVIINSGWQQAANWRAFIEARRTRRPHVLWAGSTEHEESLLRTLSKPLVRQLVSRSDAWVSYGSASARYLESLGAARARIVHERHAIDNDGFLARLTAAKPRAAELRARLGLDDRAVVLYVGSLIDRKGVDELIRAMGQLASRHPQARLLLLGDGSRRAALEAEAQRCAPGKVVFGGHIGLEELTAYYAMADCFVLPSLHEVWGLVINEAALAGLPVVATSVCGAAADLIRDGETGYVVPPRAPAALAAALARLLDDPTRARSMGAAGHELVARTSNAHVGATALARAATLALEHAS